MWAIPSCPLRSQNVVLTEVDANGFETPKIELLDVCGRGFQNDLILEVLVEAIGILTVATVGWSPRRLHVGDAIGCRTEHAKKCLRMHCARTDLGIVRLLQDAAL